MANVKTGKDIVNIQDVQNLVIGVINRQEKMFLKNDIFVMVKHYMHDSSFTVSDEDIEKIIGENLDYLYRKTMLDCKNGYYMPKIISV